MPDTTVDSSIQSAFDALSALLTPQPALDGTGNQAVTLWQNQSAKPTPAYAAAGAIVSAVFTASDDLKGVGASVNAGLVASANALNAIANALTGPAMQQVTSVQNTIDTLQKALSVAQTLAPGGATVVLNQGSALFNSLSGLLKTTGDIKKTADQLAALAQMLKTLASAFPGK